MLEWAEKIPKILWLESMKLSILTLTTSRIMGNLCPPHPAPWSWAWKQIPLSHSQVSMILLVPSLPNPNDDIHQPLLPPFLKLVWKRNTCILYPSYPHQQSFIFNNDTADFLLLGLLRFGCRKVDIIHYS